MAEDLGVSASKAQAGKWFARFQANNFYLSRDDSGRAPLESAWAPVAAAVCPRLALLNHSCSPNCAIVTVWPGTDSAGPQHGGGSASAAVPASAPHLALVARQPIAEGEELCHSYIDSHVAPAGEGGGGHREERQANLQRIYGFVCSKRTQHALPNRLLRVHSYRYCRGVMCICVCGQHVRDVWPLTPPTLVRWLPRAPTQTDRGRFNDVNIGRPLEQYGCIL
jgi:hypothetical protein